MTSLHNARKNNKDDYETPDALFKQVDNYYHFTLDAAATKSNTKCKAFLSDALVEDWPSDEIIWCNPPFSLKERFLEMVCLANLHNSLSVFLLPANAFETEWWRKYVLPMADDILVLIPRVNFFYHGKEVKGVGFSTCLVTFKPFPPGSHPQPRLRFWHWK